LKSGRKETIRDDGVLLCKYFQGVYMAGKEKKTAKKVIGIVGSPRQGGNTDILVEEVLAGAREAGTRVEKVILNDLKIGYCQGCNRCIEAGKCYQEDDMPLLLKKMQESDVWVLGTPVYWWGPSAQFKTFLDRWYGARRIVRFRDKQVILAIPLGDTNNDTARHLLGMLQDSFDYLKMKIFASIVALGAYQLGAVRDQKSVMNAARNAGSDIIAAERPGR
jgi:multimeric flavodoxin WrbA